MTHALDQSILELLNASRDDEETLQLPLRDRTFGFHAQQAVEKLLKAMIGGHEKRYEHTHDIGSLVEQLIHLDEQLPGDAILFESLTSYAGIWRYQEPQPVSIEQRDELKRAIANLRKFTIARLQALRPSVDWSAVGGAEETLN